ncbi:uncharacterized protein LACBIDRAFT_324322 [Laccaria bicolor S238N-H82]|uniref:Predicted protein n=1 Tax=Laccaria bicolor (strain S238N-H82 / ATCC MYA-4686) TaxID=486041 RepID=B0D1F8_LACBS|nr:uncharacterized protein LACBIDRAFT_324322 [Laccaria bicolor S238N-H82]EDR11626.1 predicted protein [Laccaria bicolor S238N-H82]|eukprot:XP_001877523.1 predicted protein [Laccaria bicolor S238N-H82]
MATIPSRLKPLPALPRGTTKQAPVQFFHGMTEVPENDQPVLENDHPANDPTKIVRDIKQRRSNAGHIDPESLHLGAVESNLFSPDVRHVELPPDTIQETPSSPRITHQEATVSSIGIPRVEPVTYTTFAHSSRSSPPLTLSDGSSSFEDEDDIVREDDDRLSSRDEHIAEIHNEKVYRHLLKHHYHSSLIIPLWNPCPIDLGAVGYLREGRFITLFNAFRPKDSNDGRESRGSKVRRKYTYPLQAGHGIAVMCVETTEYRYLEPLEALSNWFQANVTSIIISYGTQHTIQKEDLFLVIGTLCAPNHALFVSHSHPDGQAYFSVYSSPKIGQPWGIFTPQQPASKVSPRQNGPWNSVLLARLRFMPGHSKPTFK